jgi:AAT family amino acid transporter/GABA permease
MSVPQSSTSEPTPKLGAALRQRHVTMIALGGIIGAGLFVGSSATLATVGPAACVSYLVAGIVVLMVMRMLGEMALAVPGVGSFTEYARIGLGNWAGFTNGWLYWYFWVIVAAAIAGVLAAMGTDPALRPQLMASAASLAVASAAYLLTAKRQPRDSSATGYLSSIGEQAIEGSK